MNIFQLSEYSQTFRQLQIESINLLNGDLCEEVQSLFTSYAQICSICVKQGIASLQKNSFHNDYISVNIKSNKVALEKKILFQKSDEKKLFFQMCQKYFLI